MNKHSWCKDLQQVGKVESGNNLRFTTGSDILEHTANVDLMLVHRLRRWPNTKTTSGERPVTTDYF